MLQPWALGCTWYNVTRCWEEEEGEGAFSYSPTCSKWEMSLCSCSCPIAIFVPGNVGHEQSLMMAQSLSQMEKRSCDNSCPFGKAAEIGLSFSSSQVMSCRGASGS